MFRVRAPSSTKVSGQTAFIKSVFRPSGRRCAPTPAGCPQAWVARGSIRQRGATTARQCRCDTVRTRIPQSPGVALLPLVWAYDRYLTSDYTAPVLALAPASGVKMDYLSEEHNDDHC